MRVVSDPKCPIQQESSRYKIRIMQTSSFGTSRHASLLPAHEQMPIVTMEKSATMLRTHVHADTAHRSRKLATVSWLTVWWMPAPIAKNKSDGLLVMERCVSAYETTETQRLLGQSEALCLSVLP